MENRRKAESNEVGVTQPSESNEVGVTQPSKSTWGGKRREGVNQTPKHFKIDNDLIDRLKMQKNQNRFINEAIREKLASL